MGEEFTTNPFEWSVDGNLIGLELGQLTTLSNFTTSHASVSYDTDQVVDGNTITMVKLIYVA